MKTGVNMILSKIQLIAGWALKKYILRSCPSTKCCMPHRSWILAKIQLFAGRALKKYILHNSAGTEHSMPYGIPTATIFRGVLKCNIQYNDTQHNSDIQSK
jgi:hypothetical protein